MQSTAIEQAAGSSPSSGSGYRWVGGKSFSWCMGRAFDRFENGRRAPESQTLAWAAGRRA